MTKKPNITMIEDADAGSQPKYRSRPSILDRISKEEENLCAECRQIKKILGSMYHLQKTGFQDPAPPLRGRSNFQARSISTTQQGDPTNRPRNVSREDTDEWEGRGRSVTIPLVAGSICPSCVVISKTLLAYGLLAETTQVHLSAACLANGIYTLAATLKGITVHVSPLQVPSSYIQSYSPLGILPDFAEDCLRHCVRSHAGVCANQRHISSAIGAVPICLIDLESESLVFASSRSMYVALSYVWGSSNITSEYSVSECSRKNLSKMLQKGFFGADEFRFPPTILDAMRFTKLMGVRYLWIDRYCIVQDDDQDKHNQLRAMGSIYYNAQFTIIAAEGDITHGLRGFKESRSTWKLRDCPRICSALKTYVGITYDPVTENTLWSTRGWTFQEQIFARKSFIFRGETIIFKCCKSIWQEGTSVPVSYDNSRYALGRTKLTIYKWPNMLYFKGLLEGFALRELTYPCDSLDALTGVLGALEASFPGGFLSGLPEVCFDIALLWQSRGTLEDRVRLAETECKPIRNLPSWSWARWKGSLDFTVWEAAAECLFLSFYNQNFCFIKKIVEWQKQSHTSVTTSPVADCYNRNRALALDASLSSPVGWKRVPLRRDIGQGPTVCHRLDNSSYKFIHESLGNDVLFRFPIPLSTGIATVRDNQLWSHYIQGRVKRTYLSIIPRKEVQEEGDCWFSVMGKFTSGEGDSQVGVVRVHD